MFEKLSRLVARRDFKKFPDDENGDVLFGIWKQETNLDDSRTVDFSLVSPAKAQADSMADQLQSRQGKVEVSYFEEKTCWDLRFSTKMVPSWEAISEMEEWLGSAAAKHHGRNDGWGFFSEA